MVSKGKLTRENLARAVEIYYEHAQPKGRDSINEVVSMIMDEIKSWHGSSLSLGYKDFSIAKLTVSTYDRTYPSGIEYALGTYADSDRREGEAKANEIIDAWENEGFPTLRNLRKRKEQS